MIFSEKTLKDLENQLLSKIDQFSERKKDAVDLEKVARYINLVRQYYSLQEEIDTNGLIVETRNAAQTFFKANPALEAQLKISAQLLALEKSFSFRVESQLVEDIHHSDGSDLI